jgi:hypothetical protein
MCNHHTDKISKGAYHSSVGHYVAMSNPARGFQSFTQLNNTMKFVSKRPPKWKLSFLPNKMTFLRVMKKLPS